jgi:hypothetical protein
MNRTPKMPPRPDCYPDDHYHPERLLRVVAEILLVATVVAGLTWWWLT